MKIDILTLFPQMFAPLNESLLGKAQAKQLLEIAICDFRQYATNKQHHVATTAYLSGYGCH